MLTIPKDPIPIQEIKTQLDIQLFIKREDLIHPQISGNKFWKLFHNVNQYLLTNPEHPKIITFGGAFSNHIASVAAFGELFGIPTIGVIRGDELTETWQDNPTLLEANNNGMEFLFVTREAYRDKEFLTRELIENYGRVLIIPEGGTNEAAVEGIRYMLGNETQEFDYLCSAVGTGGTISGISKFAQNHQNVLGVKVVNDDSLEQQIVERSQRNNVYLVNAEESKYGKITDDNVAFVNWFYEEYKIPLDPIYTGKMMQKIFDLARENYFSEGAKVLAFHTGGLQGIKGANRFLKSKGRALIEFEDLIF